MAAQVLFTADTTPSLADLDANTEACFGLLELVTYPSHGTAADGSPFTSRTGSNAKFTVDSSFNLVLTAGGLSLTASGATIGYGTGSGGAVTQATSKTTAVTLNKSAGQITTNNAALAAGATAAFQLVNSTISATDVVCVSIASASSSSAYRAHIGTTSAGFAVVALTNISGGSLSDAVVINFAVIKAAAS